MGFVFLIRDIIILILLHCKLFSFIVILHCVGYDRGIIMGSVIKGWSLLA